jgi:hypothetical protein
MRPVELRCGASGFDISQPCHSERGEADEESAVALEFAFAPLPCCFSLPRYLAHQLLKYHHISRKNLAI